MTTGLSSTEAFEHNWSVEVLKAAPMIAPARQFTYPLQIAGEEDAMARGALQLMVRPAVGLFWLRARWGLSILPCRRACLPARIRRSYAP
jgi:hypothetical protein